MFRLIHLSHRSRIPQPRQLATLLASCAIVLLNACSGSSDSTVAADFSVKSVKGTVSGQNVTLDLSSLGNCAVDLKAMVVTINASGYQISPDPTAARDYSSPVDFTLTAPDGTKATYKVTVTGAACVSATPTPTPTPTPVACTAAPINPAEAYSLVFKGCDANNVATYYDKTECVRQNSTGLIWQGQMPAGSGHLRANDQHKTNFDNSTELQKYNGGNPIAPTQAEIDASTNSIGFKNAVNATNLCGSNAWRMPNKDELFGLVKTTESPTIDNSWFPNTPQYGVYWTSSPYAGYASLAWVVMFSYGFAYYGYRDGWASNDFPVRLVR